MKLQEEEEEKALEEYCRDDAHLAKLGFNDDQETKKTNKRKSAPRSLAPDGPRRQNPVRLSRAKTNYELYDEEESKYEEKEDDEDEGSSEGGVPCAALSDDHFVPAMNVDISNPTIFDEGSRVLVVYKAKLYKAAIHRHREKSGKSEYLIHYDGNKKSTVTWIPVDHIKMERMTRECVKEHATVDQIKMDSQFEPGDEMENNEEEDDALCDNEDDKDHEDEADHEDNKDHDGQISSEDDEDNEDDKYDKYDENDENDEDEEDDEDDEDDEDNEDEEDEEDDKDHKDDDVGAFSNEVEGEVPGTPHSTLIKRLHILNQTPTYRRSDTEKDQIDLLIKELLQMKSRGEIGGKPCGLGCSWTYKKKVIGKHRIGRMVGRGRTFKVFPEIICTGNAPSHIEVINAIK